MRTRQQVTDMRCESAMKVDEWSCRCELCFYAREVRVCKQRIKDAERAWSLLVLGRPDEDS